jgi:hypothetical protein
MTVKDIIDDAIEFWTKIRSEDEVTLKFKKKDDTIRIMKCTLNFSRIPVADRPKDVNIPKILKLVKDHNIIHVFDLEKQEWRSVPFDRCEWLQTPENRRYYMKKR